MQNWENVNCEYRLRLPLKLHDFLKCTLPTRVVGPGSDKLCGTWVRQALWDQVYFYFRGAKICINSHRIPGFTSLLQTHLMRGSLKGFAQLAIGHNQRGDPPPPPWGGHVFMVRTKPSKQPFGLVAHGVPIERGAAGA